jgi:aldehyde:ferredoxin oxidoreductase
LNQDSKPGYSYKLLRINLSTREMKEEQLDSESCRKYLGGAGIIAKILLSELPESTDPLTAENKLIFATGPITGIALAGSGRHAVGSLSPLTGGIAKSEVGEYWGRNLRCAGFEAIIIEGKSEKPVYIWIDNDKVQIKNADHLWGKSTKETQAVIRSELLAPKARIAMIGKGGENLIRFACIMHGLFDAAGRGGLGAVMGSKKLKAIAVRGNSIKIANSEGIQSVSKWLKDNKSMYSGLQQYGTSPGIRRWEEIGNLAIRNWSEEVFPNVDQITVQTIKDTIRVGMDGCYACPIRCKKRVKIVQPYEVDSDYGGPEYETIGALGTNCGVDNLAAIAKASELCNGYSLDTISTGGTIAFAMECYEKGIITKQDTGGIDLKFGNADAMLEMIHKISNREGFGNLLAEGSARAANAIANGAEKYAIHVKGQELPLHDPRVNRSAAVSYSIDPQGPDHNDCLLDIAFSAYASEPDVTIMDSKSLGYISSVPYWDIGPKKMRLLTFMRQKRILMDSMLICTFLPYSINQLMELVKDVTGWNTTTSELLRIARRTMTVCQLINMRRGFSASDDMLPARFFQPVNPNSKRPSLSFNEVEAAKRYYFSFMNWDDNGVPKKEAIEELGIE